MADKIGNGFGEEESSNSKINSKSKILNCTTDDKLRETFRQIKLSKTPAVINYGASWYVSFYALDFNRVTVNTCHMVDKMLNQVFLCGVCSQILPAFCEFRNKFPKLSFVYADIDECPEATEHIRYTPTFHFYRDGERVDEMVGAGEERLQDRLWLHS